MYLGTLEMPVFLFIVVVFGEATIDVFIQQQKESRNEETSKTMKETDDEDLV